MSRKRNVKENLEIILEDVEELYDYWIGNNLENVSLANWEEEIEKIRNFMKKYIVDELKENIDYLGGENENV